MSYLSLLWTSESQGISKSSAGVSVGEQHESFSPPARSNAAETAVPVTGTQIEQVLPSGIVSMEHWLDLNA